MFVFEFLNQFGYWRMFCINQLYKITVPAFDGFLCSGIPLFYALAAIPSFNYKSMFLSLCSRVLSADVIVFKVIENSSTVLWASWLQFFKCNYVIFQWQKSSAKHHSDMLSELQVVVVLRCFAGWLHMSPHVLTKVKEAKLNLNVLLHWRIVFRIGISKSIVTPFVEFYGREQSSFW